MCLCVYVCMYVFVCVYVRMNVCMYVRMNVCMYVCMYVCFCVCVCKYECMYLCFCVYVCVCIQGAPRRKGPNFGRVFLRSNYTYITQNTYIQSSMVTEILNIEK